MISRKIKDLKESLDVDMQLIASELDTSVKNLRYISRDSSDAILVEAVDKLIEDIEKVEGVEITSFDDNTVLYEYLNEAVIIHDILGVKYILFDSLITAKMEMRLRQL